MQTVDRTTAYSITGAPRVFDGKVVIGNGGADYGVRGYVTAYDAETGNASSGASTPCPAIRRRARWRASDKVMAMAAKTWTGEWWKYGGGGTVWDSIVYDPELEPGVPRHRQRLAAGGSTSAARAAATTCSCAPSSR